MKKPTRKSDTDDSSTRLRIDVHEAITAKIVAAIEAGAGEFQMPWHRPGVAFTIPKNALTEKQYRGSNILSLWIDADAKKFEHQLYATFKQWQELGAQVRKGERGSMIVKYGEWVPKHAGADSKPETGVGDEDQAKRLFAKAAWVFNVQQVDGYSVAPTVQRPDLTTRLAHVDAFIANTGAEFREGGQRAFYRHRDQSGEGDFIQMPPRSLFTGTATSTPTESYESTRCHELSHWVGASHRLNREFGQRFGDKAYSFEELVAELSAAFLCAELEITNTPRADHAQYISNWLAVLKGDSKAVFSAASLATRAVDYLNGLQPKTVDNGELDASFCYDPIEAKTMRLVPLYREDLYLVGSPTILGTIGDLADWPALGGFPLVLGYWDHRTRQIIEAAARAAGTDLRSVDEVEPRTLKRELLVHHGRCSIVPYGLFLDEIKSGELVARQIKPRLSRTVALLLNANLAAPVAQFLSTAVRSIVRQRIAENELGWRAV